VKLRHPHKESRNCGSRIPDCGSSRNAASASRPSPHRVPRSAIRN
jgi:hypothetical protein